MQPEQPGSAAGNDNDRLRPPRSQPGQPADTPLANPLDSTTRALVSGWLSEIAAQLETAADPTDAELHEQAIDATEWTRQHQDATARLRIAAREVTADSLPSSIAIDARDVLELAQNERLLRAAASLTTAIDAGRRQPDEA